MYHLMLAMLWLEQRNQFVEYALRFFTVVFRDITDIKIDRHARELWPGMNSQVRLREQEKPGCTLRRKLMKCAAHDLQARKRDNLFARSF